MPEEIMLLKDRTVVISGVGEGLGRAIAVVARREGADVVLAARREHVLEKVARTVDATGKHVIGVQTDITDETMVDSLVATSLARFGRIDCVVHCAASTASGGIIEPDWDQMRKTFEVNVWGPLRLTAAAVEPLSLRGGTVVFIGSHSSMRPADHLQLGYGASKAAIHTAMLHLAKELGRRGIRVNSVVPTYMLGPAVDAHFVRVAREEGISVGDVHQRIAARMMLGEVPRDDDVAESVVFLASERARMITGQALLVNGGSYVR